MLLASHRSGHCASRRGHQASLSPTRASRFSPTRASHSSHLANDGIALRNPPLIGVGATMKGRDDGGRRSPPIVHGGADDGETMATRSHAGAAIDGRVSAAVNGRFLSMTSLAGDRRQWECIAYCLSQLTFSERGLRKLVESFKAYEHCLSEDSVMDYFIVIINKCKKFAKPELKSCIEEFEERLNKIHIERKEQEATTRNAQAHLKNVDRLGGLGRAKKGSGKKDTDENNAEDGTSEVINPSESEESGLTSIVIEDVADGSDVQSPKTSRKGISRSRTKAGKKSSIRHKKIRSPPRKV